MNQSTPELRLQFRAPDPLPELFAHPSRHCIVLISKMGLLLSLPLRCTWDSAWLSEMLPGSPQGLAPETRSETGQKLGFSSPGLCVSRGLFFNHLVLRVSKCSGKWNFCSYGIQRAVVWPEPKNLVRVSRFVGQQIWWVSSFALGQGDPKQSSEGQLLKSQFMFLWNGGMEFVLDWVERIKQGHRFVNVL